MNKVKRRVVKVREKRDDDYHHLIDMKSQLGHEKTAGATMIDIVDSLKMKILKK